MTTPMMELDQAANDRLLLEAEQRRRDLIDRAVTSFAPHLAGQPDVTAIHLYSTNATLRKSIREAFQGRKTVVVEHCGSGKERKGVNEIQHGQVLLPLPESADLVVTRSALNFRTELLAAQLKAMPVVMPEGLGYIYARLEKQGVLVIVGADQGKAP